MPLATLFWAAVLAANPTTGREVLDAAARAAPVSAVRYTVEQRNIGDQPGPVITGTVTQQRAEVPDAGHGGGRYRAFGQVARPDGQVVPFDWSYDGATLRVLDPEQQSVIIVSSPTAGDAGRLLGFETGLLPVPLLNPAHWAAVRDRAEDLQLLPAAVCGNAECDVVAVKMKITAPDGREFTNTTHWAFDRDRRLPRMAESAATRKTITTLELDPAVEPSAFITPTPPGYAEKRMGVGGPDSRDLLAVGDRAPVWTLKDPDGNEVSLDNLKGKVVLLDFWATWCAPCKRAMPGIQTVRAKFPQDTVAIYGISVSEQPKADPAAYFRKQGFSYGLLLHGEAIAPDYKARTLPTVYVIDRNGRIIHAERGFRENAEADLIKVIERALAD